MLAVPTAVGSIWEIANGSNTCTTVASFDGTDRSWPIAVQMLGSDESFYGTTIVGGETGVGTVFEFSGPEVPEPSILLHLGRGFLVAVSSNCGPTRG
jgi:uncharacterized repeat protein (TIGR03803 family)